VTATAARSLPAPFAWEGDHIAADLGHGARALFTTRRGGVSRPPFDTLNLGWLTDDDPQDVEANRDRLAALVGVPRGRFAQGRQVHGARVVRVDAPGGEVQEADGQATGLRGVACAVLTADCMPVALAADGAVAMVHAGWRGLAGGVLEEGLEAVRDLGGAGDVVAAIGPAAGGCCYEVGDEVREALGVDVAGRVCENRFIDLKAIARERLVAAGATRVHDTGLCTMCSDRSLFFSHRGDQGRTGRQGGVAWRS
jgi:YfiH family protein